MKFIYPLLGMAFVMYALQSEGGDIVSQLPPIAIWMTLSISIYQRYARMKDVSVDEDFLYASDYLTEISIPLSEIDGVTQPAWGSNFQVTIHLKSPSAFGDKIIFIPANRVFSFYRPHPVVEELRELAATKNAPARFVPRPPMHKSLP